MAPLEYAAIRAPTTADQVDLVTKSTPDTVLCPCCDLDFPGWLAPDAGQADEWLCQACDGHRDDPLAMARDHADELRVRWQQTLEDLAAETFRADDYREKMLAACRSRDNVLKQFERLARYHRATEHGCICGKRNCETLAVVDTGWINDRIAAMLRLG